MTVLSFDSQLSKISTAATQECHSRHSRSLVYSGPLYSTGPIDVESTGLASPLSLKARRPAHSQDQPQALPLTPQKYEPSCEGENEAGSETRAHSSR